MREVTETRQVYKFGDNDKVDQNIRDHVANHWDMYEHCMNDRLDTLKAIASLLDANLDYSLSCVPDRGEFIKFSPKYDELNFDALWEAIDIEKECPLTGVCYDHDIIDHLSKYNLTVDSLNNASGKFMSSIHDEYQSMLTDEYITDMCEANEYEFNANGTIY